MAAGSQSLNNYLFGPLSSQYCLIFYVICIYFFVAFILFILATVGQLFSKKMTPLTVLLFAVSALSHFAVYIGWRLIYNMCLSSIRP